MQRITPGFYTFTGLLVGRVYLIRDPDGMTLIDTGLGLAADKILAQIAAAGGQARQIKRILITHAHPDHIGGLPKLKAQTGAQVIASALERPTIEGRQPIPGPPAEQLPSWVRLLRPPPVTLPGTPVDREVADGELLPDVMGGLRVIATPGHAPGHLAFWQPERRILFCGDVMMRIPRPQLRLPVAAFTVDMAENKRSIRRLAALDAAMLCLGHGQPLTQQTAETVRAFARQVGVG
ncbi:MAG TPA: MBL fold metallo-hydrolase [Chloroflexia bacterium]|nr:MBL fold metallo-hydrolase [Chloroflexia bacterium]